MDKENSSSTSYWKASLALVGRLLIVWFFVSFGCGILFKEELDEYSVGGAPLGFWMAQQGSILRAGVAAASSSSKRCSLKRPAEASSDPQIQNTALTVALRPVRFGGAFLYTVRRERVAFGE